MQERVSNTTDIETIEKRRQEDKKFADEYLGKNIAPEYIPLISLDGVRHPNRSIAYAWIDRFYNLELAELKKSKFNKDITKLRDYKNNIPIRISGINAYLHSDNWISE